jgi:hypothetical protein
MKSIQEKRKIALLNAIGKNGAERITASAFGTIYAAVLPLVALCSLHRFCALSSLPVSSRRCGSFKRRSEISMYNNRDFGQLLSVFPLFLPSVVTPPFSFAGHIVSGQNSVLERYNEFSTWHR